MRKLILTIAANIAAIVVFGQYPQDIKHDYSWIFGYPSEATQYEGNSILSYNGNSFDTIYATNGNTYYYLEGTSISDTAGNLLMHCNGFAVYDSAFNIISGADSLNCCNIVWQNNYNDGYPNIDGVTIVKKPGSDNEYWVINKSVESAVVPVQHGISYALRLTRIIDGQDGTFQTAIRDTFFYADSIEGIGTMELCRHANGRDWWLMQRDYYANHWYVFLVDPTGISLKNEFFFNEYQAYTYAQSVFSPDGSKFIIGGTHATINDSMIVARFDFDRCTGTLSNPDYYYWLNDTTVVSSGCAISPNSRYLYVATTLDMYQFDLDATDWKASRTVVATRDTFLMSQGYAISFTRMQLAPDNKIYNAGGLNEYLSTIDNPDEAGLACNVNQHSFKLPARNHRTMPNFPNYRMGPIDGSDCDTLGIDVLSDLSSKLDNNNASINLYPNPAIDYITLMIPRITKSWEFVIYNIQGKEVFRNKSRGAFRSYDISFLSNGLYLWKVRYEDGRSENGKLVKE
jgi:hypothetical protein